MKTDKEIFEEVLKKFKETIKTRVNRKRVDENDIWLIENVVKITSEEKNKEINKFKKQSKINLEVSMNLRSKLKQKDEVIKGKVDALIKMLPRFQNIIKRIFVEEKTKNIKNS